MDPFADDLTAEEGVLDRIDAALDAGLGDLIVEIVPDSGEPATAEDLDGVYEVKVNEAVEVAGEAADLLGALEAHEADVERRLRARRRPSRRLRRSPSRSCGGLRLRRPRARERRPSCGARRGPRASRAGPSGDPDSSEPGEPAPPHAAGRIIAGAAP